MVLFDLAVAGFFVVTYLDIKEDLSPGYKELEIITGAYGALCAGVGLLGFTAALSGTMNSYSLLTPYFYAIVLKCIGSIATCCALFVLEDEVCYEAKAISFQFLAGGYSIPSALPCDTIVAMIAGPPAVLFFICIFELVVLASAQSDIAGPENLMVFRKPLLYQYTERNNVPSLSPRNPDNAGLFDGTAPTEHDASTTTHNPSTGFFRR